MTHRPWPKVLTGLAVVVVVASKIAAYLVAPATSGSHSGVGSEGRGPLIDVLLFGLMTGLYLALGVVLVTRRPDNVISWLILAFVVILALAGLTDAITGTAPPTPQPWWWSAAAWYASWYFPALLGLLLVLGHLFPTGRPIPGRWRWAAYTAFVACSAAVAAMFSGKESDPPNPFAVEVPHVVQVVAITVWGLAWIVALLSLVPVLFVRFRRSAGVERQQLKVFLFCAAGAVAAWILQAYAERLFFVTFLLPGIAVGVALLRYRLYDIDRLISRTTSYAIVSAVVLATYGLVVTVVLQLLPDSSNLAVAAATLAAAAVAGRPSAASRRWSTAVSTARSTTDNSPSRRSERASVVRSTPPQSCSTWNGPSPRRCNRHRSRSGCVRQHDPPTGAHRQRRPLPRDRRRPRDMHRDRPPRRRRGRDPSLPPDHDHLRRRRRSDQRPQIDEPHRVALPRIRAHGSRRPHRSSCRRFRGRRHCGLPDGRPGPAGST